MKDEEMAEEYICNGKCQDDITRNYVHCKTCTRLNDFLAGLKAQLKAEHTKGELDFVKINCNSSCKKIAELEKENTELEQKLEQTEKDLADYQFNYPKIKELEQEIVNLNSTLDLRKMQLDDSAEIIKEMQSNVDTLQKKNAELKEKIEVLECDNYNANCNLNLITDQLTKATKLLKEAQGYIENEDNELYDKIEQFLKEIKK